MKKAFVKCYFFIIYFVILPVSGLKVERGLFKTSESVELTLASKKMCCISVFFQKKSICTTLQCHYYAIFFRNQKMPHRNSQKENKKKQNSHSAKSEVDSEELYGDFLFEPPFLLTSKKRSFPLSMSFSLKNWESYETTIFLHGNWRMQKRAEACENSVFSFYQSNRAHELSLEAFTKEQNW